MKQTPFFCIFADLLSTNGIMKKSLFIVLITSLLSISNLWAQNKNYQTCRTKMDQVINSINQMYVDTVDFDPMVDKAISAMLKELDPHTAYIQKKDVQAMTEPLQGSFDGMLKQRRFNIVYITPDSPKALNMDSPKGVMVEYNGKEMTIQI